MAGAAAKRYARAIFELAREEDLVERWAERLHTMRDILGRPEVVSVLANPTIDVKRREEAAAALLERHAGREVTNLARLLVGANRVAELDGIIEQFELLADEAAGRVRATATTAVPLTRSDADKLEASLSRRLGREVRLSNQVDRAIVGGLVLRMGDRVIDASVATRLQQLRHHLVAVD
jgi:F-type H+-transporting ATPase subunit delta